MRKTYKSAIDLWFVVLLAAAALFPIFAGISIAFGLHWLHWHETAGRLVGFCFVGGGLLVCALIGTFVWPCRYTLEETMLKIQCGVMTWTIPYRNIRRIEISCSLWIAPALSVNRVRLVTPDGAQLISPEKRETFVAELQARLAP